MRHAAAQLRTRRSRLDAVVRRLNTEVGAMRFAGPAASRFRRAIEVEQQRMREMSWVLQQAADTLERGAASVEADPTAFYQG
jgi:uncharacterized protein YukE